MRRFRRPLLWLPLVVSAAFFAACGWRNAHLRDESRNLRLTSAIFAARQVPKGTLIAFVSPEDARLIEQSLKQLNKKTKVVAEMPANVPNGATRGASWLEVGAPKFQNRFHATVQVAFGDFEGKQQAPIITLTRSPIKFWDNRWHIASVEQQISIGRYY